MTTNISIEGLLLVAFPHNATSPEQKAALGQWLAAHDQSLQLEIAELRMTVEAADELCNAVYAMASMWGSARQYVDEDGLMTTAWWQTIKSLREAAGIYRVVRTGTPVIETQVPKAE